MCMCMSKHASGNSQGAGDSYAVSRRHACEITKQPECVLSSQKIRICLKKHETN